MSPSFIYAILLALSLDAPVPAQLNAPAAARSTAFSSNTTQDTSDSALAALRAADKNGDSSAIELPPGEHFRRANVYLSNRAFEEARRHLNVLTTRYASDPLYSSALFLLGRSFLLEGRYLEAAPIFGRVADGFPQKKEGQDALSMQAASLLRGGKPEDAVQLYIKYTERYPAGDRLESSYLNVIDGLREAGKSAQAERWVEIIRERFRGTVTETNAIFALLRLRIAEGKWDQAVAVADLLRSMPLTGGVATTRDEVSYLKAFSLESAGRKSEALSVYSSIPDSTRSFYGMLATERLRKLGGPAEQALAATRAANVAQQIRATRSQYPASYRFSVAKFARQRDVDPRFVLSIMRQESSFRPTAKSPAAARGLLQLTIDTARRYAPAAGFTTIVERDLYSPETSISVGTEAIRALQQQFSGLYAAMAASYNGGDDNVSRWLKRSGRIDPGVFAAEVGFAESKDYVFKVMANYRAYQELYTSELLPK
jgi:soluble lytic murein transglycosylase-like protein/TolA-binding protein